jgi:hypothetical protein
MLDVAQAGVAPLHALSPSHAHGVPTVLSSKLSTSCSLISAPVFVAAVKPTYICAPTWVKRLSACETIAVAGFVAVVDRYTLIVWPTPS